MARITIHEVALAAGVSDSTVSRALRGLDKVDARTRQKVNDAAKRLHFRFSRNASSLASGRTMRVSLLLANVLNTWFDSSVLQGSYEALFPKGYDIIPNVVRSHAELNDFFAALPNDGNADALIVSSINLDSGQTDVLKRLDIPSVGLDSRTIDGFDASVLVDDSRGMEDAVTLFRHLGHRHIAFVGWPAPGDFNFGMKVRREAFLCAAQEQGYRLPDLGHGVEGKRYSQDTVIGDVRHFSVRQLSDYRNREDALSAAVAQILAVEPRPTAICVETDDFAVPLVGRLRSLGIRVPEDMSVVGFDDADVAAAAGLTTVHQDPVDMARIGARKALHLMNGEQPDEPHTLMRPTLVLRATTAAAPVV